MNSYAPHVNGNGSPRPRVDAPVPVPGDAMPPFNLDIEQALLGMVLHDPGQLHEVLLILDAGDFFGAGHRVVFGAIKARYDAAEPVDFRLVIEHLEAAGELKAAGGEPAFEAMSAEGGITVNAKYYAQVVKQLSIARQLIEAGEETRREAYSRMYEADELLGRAEERVFAIARGQSRDDTVDAATVADEAWELLMRRTEGVYEGVTTGLVDLDKIIACIPNGGLSIIAGRPGSGKTSIAMNICEHVSFNSGIATLFLSLEMKRQDLGLRLLASQARVSGKLIKRAKLLLQPEHRDDMDRLADARERVAGSNLFLNHTPGRTVTQIAANARLEKARHDIGLVVIDYMSLINMQPRRGESRQEEVARTSIQLKDLARTLNLPVLLLCQLNRGSENREDHRPRMSDLRETGQLEQDAELIMLVHRPEVYDPMDRPGEADVLVAKNRTGETGRAQLAFLSDLTRFENLARPTRPDDDWHPED